MFSGISMEVFEVYEARALTSVLTLSAVELFSFSLFGSGVPREVWPMGGLAPLGSCTVFAIFGGVSCSF